MMTIIVANIKYFDVSPYFNQIWHELVSFDFLL